MHAASCAFLASEVVLSPTQLLLLHLWLLMGSSCALVTVVMTDLKQEGIHGGDRFVEMAKALRRPNTVR